MMVIPLVILFLVVFLCSTLIVSIFVVSKRCERYMEWYDGDFHLDSIPAHITQSPNLPPFA